MPARREEVGRAVEEGVRLCVMAAPDEFTGENGKLTGVVCRRTVPGDPEYPGGRRGITMTDELFTLEADAAVLALGFTAEPIPGLDTRAGGLIVVDRDTLETSRPNAYAGGDAVTGAYTLVHAMAAGRTAAEQIILRCRERGLIPS